MAASKLMHAMVVFAIIGLSETALAQVTPPPLSNDGLQAVPSTSDLRAEVANRQPSDNDLNSVPSLSGGAAGNAGGLASPPAGNAMPPSVSGGDWNQSGRTTRNISSGMSGGSWEVPSAAGQKTVEFDLRGYTGYLPNHERPHQAIVDWVLRDTGTDMWFTEPFGFMNGNRETLTVYHTDEVQQVVKNVVDKFVAGEKEPVALGLRVLTVGSPNWRTRAVALMEHVTVSSPGVQAWLVSKENAAILLAQLRSRTDTREVQALDIAIYNGQAESLTSTRRRNYVRNIRPAPAGWPPYEPETGQVEEGYKLEISPLLNLDGTTLDCVLRADIDQVEKLVPVDLDLPLPNGQLHRARVEVPQVASWRLHERFRWPKDRVLVLSCGVVASPDRPQSSLPLLNLESLTGQSAGRADALLFVQFKGRADKNIPVGSRVVSPTTGFNRGRY